MWAKRDAQVPVGHIGAAWEAAEASLFLAGDQSKFVRGIELVVDAARVLVEGNGFTVRELPGGFFVGAGEARGAAVAFVEV